MSDFFAKLALAVALAGATAASQASADAGDDQYAVAAGHYARDRWQLAATEFQTFRRKFPQHKKFNQALFFEAEAHVQLGQYRPAIDLFRDFVQREPESRYHRQALFRWGESSYLLDDHAAALPVLEQFRQSYGKDKLNAYVLAYLGQIALQSNELETARERFKASLTQFPESQSQDECRFGLARVAENEEDFESARRVYLALSAKAGSPWADDAQFRMGTLHYSQGEFEDAVAAFSQFEATFPKSDLLDRARLGRGWAMFKLQQWDQAQQQFNALQASKQVGIEARYWLGLTHKAQKNWKLAAEILLSASNDSDEQDRIPAMVFHAGDALARQGDAPAAKQQFDRLLKSWPQDAWADDARLGNLQLVLSAADHNAVDAQYVEFLKHFPESELLPEARRIQAQSLLARKEFDKASALLAQAVDGKTGDALHDAYLYAASLNGLTQYAAARTALAPVLRTAEGQLLADARLLEASLLVAQLDFAGAIQPLEAHLAAEPKGADSAQCRAQLAACYARTKDLTKARARYVEFQAQMPPDDLRRSATQQLAEAVYAAGDHAWSATLFQSLTSKDEPIETAARSLSGLGWSRYEAGELKPAADAFGQLLERYPHHALAAEARMTRAQILEKLDQLPEAVTLYEQLIEQHPRDARLPLALRSAARLHDKLGQDAQAAVLYERFSKEFPDHEFIAAALYEWAWVLRELNRHEDADQRFQSIYKNHRESRYWPDATFRLAERAQATKRPEEARRLLDDLTDSKPDQKLLPHVLYLQGQSAAALEQWSEVIAAMRPLCEAGEDSPFKHLAEYWTAEALYRQGELGPAGERLAELSHKLLKANEPWTAMVALRHAQVLAHQKKWPEAQKLAASIAERWPGFEQQHEADYVVGRALAARGEFDHARTAYERVIRSTTGGKTETAAMAQWMIGETYYHQKNYETALREYLRLEILYDYPTWQAAALLQAGKCAEELGQWKQAMEHYQRVVKEFSQTSFVDEAQKRLTAARERLAGR